MGIFSEIADSSANSDSQPTLSDIGGGLYRGATTALGQMIDQFSGGIQQARQGVQTIRKGSTPLGGLKAGLDVESGLASAVTSPLAPVFTPVGKAIQSASDFVTDIPAVQNTASKLPAIDYGEGARVAGNISNITGTIAGGEVSPKIPSAVGDIGNKVAKTSDALIGGSVDLAGKAVKSAVGSIEPTLESDIGKALGFTGKMSGGQALGKTFQSIRALGHLVENAPNIKVTDASGVQVPFQPSKASFLETLDAWKQTRDSIYAQYTRNAAKAGEKGAVFGANDFHSLLSALDAEKENSTSAFKAKANSLEKDIIDNFGFLDRETGNKIFYDTNLLKLQNFLERVNVDVNPASDKAAAEVSLKLSQKIREIMDTKIEESTGAQYQAERNKLADLKSIELDLVNQFKRAARGQGGTIGKYVEGFGTIDALAAILHGSPIGVASGLGTFTLGKLMNMLKDPTAALQRSFKKIENQRSSAKVSTINLPRTIPKAISNTSIISKNVSPSHGGVKHSKIKELIDAGVQINSSGVATIYRGGNVPPTLLKNLRYNDYLSSVKQGKDITGNSGAAEYGKNVVTLHIPAKDLKIENGELRYVGQSISLAGGKYPSSFYKEYNDYHGSNLTAKEIDKQNDIWDTARALAGYNDAKARMLLKSK